MPNGVSISIGIISDPHVVIKGAASNGTFPKQHSFFEVDDETGRMSGALDKQHPWLDLISLLKTPGGSNASPMSVDALLCAGDLGFRGSIESIHAAWKLLQDAGAEMNAGLVAAATGNHDVHSRSRADEVGKSPVRIMPTIRGYFETLKLLQPAYPFVARSPQFSPQDDRYSRAKYFGEGATLYDFEKFRLLILNSCADHGHDEFEYERGTISASTLKAIETDMQTMGTEPDKINLVLVHHPPQPDSAHGSGTLDHLHGGDQLITLLEDTGQQWLLIHGHKHNGTISCAGSSNVTVFSAASLGVRLEQQVKGMRNQFYIVKLEIDPTTLSLQGAVQCWDWFENFGWKFARPSTGGISHGCGFGNRMNTAQLALLINQYMQNKTLPMKWSKLIEDIPALRFVLPDEMQRVKTRLENIYQYVIEPDSDGHWFEVARKA
jgi:hypothetical protein